MGTSVRQAVVVDGKTLNPNQEFEKLALFNAKGNVFPSIPQVGDGSFAIYAPGVMFGEADATSTIKLGLTYTYEDPPAIYGPYIGGGGSIVGGSATVGSLIQAGGLSSWWSPEGYGDPAFSFGLATGNSIISSYGAGSVSFGVARDGAVIGINPQGGWYNTSRGCMAFGDSMGVGAFIGVETGSKYGSLLFGRAYSRDPGRTAKIIDARGTGMAFGLSSTIATNNGLISTYTGALAFGSAGGGTIDAHGTGSLSFGTSGQDGMIKTSSGSMAFGTAFGSDRPSSVYALNSSFAGGRAQNRNVEATGFGTFAFGYASPAQGDKDILASGMNSAQFFPGSNGLNNSLRVGDGIRLRGIKETTPTSDLANGDIWLGADNQIRIRSNGSTKIL